MVCRVFFIPIYLVLAGFMGKKRELGRADGDLSLSASARITRFALERIKGFAL
jgi:hypothetical protein